MKFGFLCSVFRVGWRIFVGGVFGCSGGIWQRNLAMVKNKSLIAVVDNRAATAWNLAVIGRWLKNGL